MKRIKHKKQKIITMNSLIFIVFFLITFFAIVLLNTYGKNVTPDVVIISNQKIDKILYQFFSDLITSDVIKNEEIKDILEITKNSRDEIVTVKYDLEKSYKALSDISKILKNGIGDLENGKIDIEIDDKYLSNGKAGLVLYVPFFLNSNNIFINNIGPRIPIVINFNETLLTNIKTKVTNYGFNNALLEVYLTVEMQKLIITPVKEYNDKFYYEIIIGALVVNGSVPEFYGGNYESNSGILDIPLN